MTRAALVLVVFAAGCNRLDQARAKSTAEKLESRHLAEVRRVADDLEKSCVRPAGVSPLAGTPLDRDLAAAEVEVTCRAVMTHGTTRLRGTPPRTSASYFEIGVGKSADAGMNAGDSDEEVAKVPSTLAPNANDLCIRRTEVEICVAYRE